MMKKITVLLLALTMVFALAGCSMFTSGDSGDKDSEYKPIEITENFTHEDPADLEFDERHVLYFAPGSSYLTMFEEQQGIVVTDGYIVMYGNEEKVVEVYEYAVCEDEAGAKKLAEFYVNEAGLDSSYEGNVNYFVKDAVMMEAEIAQWIGMNTMADETIGSYLEFYKGSFEPTTAE